MSDYAALSQGDVILSARGISKLYELDRMTGLKGRRKLFPALKQMDLDIRLGQCVGLLGRNGAGKSTLLGVLSGVTKPTTGTVTAFGRTAALIGVGQSFNIDLTGRENARRFCRIQGLSGDDSKIAVQRIFEFSELGGHFDMAVKTYSSGMKARLNFSCATSVKADLIIVDEVLAVGDAEFRSKCYGHIEASIANGQTYIMVSHSPAIIGNYCDRALVLDHGEVKFDGDPLGAMQAYDSLLNVASRKRRSQETLLAMRRRQAGEASDPAAIELNDVRLLRAADRSVIDGHAIAADESPLIVSAEFGVRQNIEKPRIGCGIRNGKGIMVSAIGEGASDGPWLAGERRRIDFQFIPRLAVGAYLVRLSISDLAEGEKKLLFDREGAIELHVVEGARAGLVDVGFRLTSNAIAPALQDDAEATEQVAGQHG